MPLIHSFLRSLAFCRADLDEYTLSSASSYMIFDFIFELLTLLGNVIIILVERAISGLVGIINYDLASWDGIS